MTTRPLTKPLTQAKADPAKAAKPMMAFYLNPGCEHKWAKLSGELQTLHSEGKTIWKCRTCEAVTTTYEWQKPET